MTHFSGSIVWPTTDLSVSSMKRASLRLGVIKTYRRVFASLPISSNVSTGLVGINKQSMCQFQRQQSVNLVGMVFVAAQMAIHNPFDSCPAYVRPRQRTIVKKDLAHVITEVVSIPNAEMEWLVASEPDTLQMQRREHVINARHPLGHPHVIGILRLEEKLEVQARQFTIETAGQIGR